MELIKYTLSIRGMRCGMCESHIQDVIRNNFQVKKVKAHRFKNNAEIYSLSPLDENKLKEVLDNTGYHYLGIIKKENIKKRFLF